MKPALALALCIMGLAACGDDSETTTRADTAAEAESTSAGEETGPAEWSYSGDTGPGSWAELSAEYAGCSGGEQSPIDLTDPSDTTGVPVEFSYRPATGAVENNGHAIEALLDRAGSITTDNTEYKLQNYHFHAPSEHVIDGEQFPAEMHLVHATGEGGLAVIGVMLTEGSKNEGLNETFSALPLAEGAESDLEKSVDPVAILPDGGEGRVFRYDGSLTTPPCSEGVLWTVYEQPIEVSAEQLGALRDAYDGNARPVQPLGDRELFAALVE